MNSYDFYFAKERQADLFKEAANDQWLREVRLGQPSMGQRMVVATGEALEAVGGWLKRRGSAGRDYASMGSGLPVPR